MPPAISQANGGIMCPAINAVRLKQFKSAEFGGCRKQTNLIKIYPHQYRILRNTILNVVIVRYVKIAINVVKH